MATEGQRPREGDQDGEESHQEDHAPGSLSSGRRERTGALAAGSLTGEQRVEGQAGLDAPALIHSYLIFFDL